MAGSAVQYRFDIGHIGFVAEGGSDLCRHSTARGTVLQALRLLPLRTDGCCQHFLGRGVTLRDADARL